MNLGWVAMAAPFPIDSHPLAERADNPGHNALNVDCESAVAWISRTCRERGSQSTLRTLASSDR
jgi:hypothetical protein